jgi:hypothetical protein
VGDNIRAIRDFPDVFLEELLRMPPYMEVEFVIDLLPGYIRSNSSPWGSASSICTEERWIARDVRGL